MGSGNSPHPYQACRDQDCERYACRIWKEGYEAGHADGIRDCPRNHGG